MAETDMEVTVQAHNGALLSLSQTHMLCGCSRCDQSLEMCFSWHRLSVHDQLAACIGP